VRTLAILVVVAALCALLIWLAPTIGAIVTVAVAAGVFFSYLFLITGGWVRKRTDETYGEKKSMWGFWD
jgi:uncharacterized RDD family membrane protein YckC